ncbi:unnamed protein product [Adineta ricciae]|uniref:G-protein coupled receptors family 1 profile domain-containing protein n=1 Tax=Adineta ricciae TaxID=249248 RepID=A0A814HR08_ADIRI|nr:unnamed protein product [Adineta ricciae]
MENGYSNVTRTLVHAILKLTAPRRHTTSSQSVCQYIYCQFSLNDQEDLDESCQITTTRLSFYDNGRRHDNSYIVMISQYLQLYIYPIFILTGIIGNSLSCYIMFRNVRRNGYSANLYLTLLAFIDCLFLLGSAIPDWISHISRYAHIKYLSDLCCRLVYWFGHFTTHLSAGLVVSVTVERFIAVRYPLLAPKINTVFHTHVVLLLLITFLFVLDGHVFILVKHFQETVHIISTCHNDTNVQYVRPTIIRCDIADEKNESVWGFVDFAVYALIPFVIILTLNSLIIHRLIHAQRLRQRMSYNKKKFPRHEYEHIHRNISDLSPTSTEKSTYLKRTRSMPVKQPSPKTSRGHSNPQSFHLSVKLSELSTETSLDIKHRSDHLCENSFIGQTTNTNNIRLTILLLFVSFSFLALTLPSVVFNLIVFTTFQSRPRTTTNFSTVARYNLPLYAQLCHAIIRLFMIMNHSINFILYFVVGKRFRRDLKRLCCGC